LIAIAFIRMGKPIQVTRPVIQWMTRAIQLNGKAIQLDRQGNPMALETRSYEDDGFPIEVQSNPNESQRPHLEVHGQPTDRRAQPDECPSHPTAA
jgi:hypothetical protein